MARNKNILGGTGVISKRRSFAYRIVNNQELVAKNQRRLLELCRNNPYDESNLRERAIANSLKK